MDNICYIAHHGIPGQKWGQQNGPPYPLDKKTSQMISKSIKKGGMSGSKSTKYDVYKGLSDIVQKDYETFVKTTDSLNNFYNQDRQTIMEYAKKAYESKTKNMIIKPTIFKGEDISNLSKDFEIEDYIDNMSGRNEAYKEYCKEKNIDYESQKRSSINAQKKYQESVDKMLNENVNNNPYLKDSHKIIVKNIVSQILTENVDRTSRYSYEYDSPNNQKIPWWAL